MLFAASTDTAYKYDQIQEFPQELSPQCLHIFQIKSESNRTSLPKSLERDIWKGKCLKI